MMANQTAQITNLKQIVFTNPLPTWFFFNDFADNWSSEASKITVGQNHAIPTV